MGNETSSNGRPEHKFLTVKEAASVLKISIFTFYDWVKNPERAPGMPVRKFGRTIRCPREKFMNWAEGK